MQETCTHANTVKTQHTFSRMSVSLFVHRVLLLPGYPTPLY